MKTGRGTALFEAKDFIALQGRGGAAWITVVRHLVSTGFEVEKLPHNTLIGLLAAKYGFRVENKEDILNAETLSAAKTVLYAPLMESWKSYGLKNFVDIPTGSALSILEALGQARHDGIIITELSKQLSIKSIHHLVDKLIALDLVHKRIVSPVSKNEKNPRECTSRTNIIHLSRFSSSYDPTVDKLCFQVEDSTIESLCDKIASFMRDKNVTLMTSKKVGEEFSFHPKQMVTLREKVNAVKDRNFSSFPIRFLSEDELDDKGNIYDVDYNNGQKKWFVSLNKPENSNVDSLHRLGEGSFMNMSYYEQSVYHLNSSKDGVTNTDLRIKLGLERAKRAYKISSDLVNIYNVYSIQTTEGKQKTYRLLGVAAAMEELNRSAELTGASSETYSMNEAEKSFFERNFNSVKNTNQRHVERMKIILCCLQANNDVRSRIEIQRRIQEVESKRGYAEIMDRKSLLKILNVMSDEGLLVIKKVTLPSTQNPIIGTETDLVVYTANNVSNVEEKIQKYLEIHKSEQDRRKDTTLLTKKKRNREVQKKEYVRTQRKKRKSEFALDYDSMEDSDLPGDQGDSGPNETEDEREECIRNEHRNVLRKDSGAHLPKDAVDQGFNRVKSCNMCKYILGLKRPGIVQSSKNLHCMLYRTHVESIHANSEITLDDVVSRMPLRFAIKNYGLPRSLMYRIVNACKSNNEDVNFFTNPENALSSCLKVSDSFAVEKFRGVLEENEDDTTVCDELVEHVREQVERDWKLLMELNILELCYASNGHIRKYRLSNLVNSLVSETEIITYWEQDVEPLLLDSMIDDGGAQVDPNHIHGNKWRLKNISQSSFIKASYDKSLVSQVYKDLQDDRYEGPVTKRKRHRGVKGVATESESDYDGDNNDNDDDWNTIEDARLIQTYMIGLLRREAVYIPDTIKAEYNHVDDGSLNESQRALMESFPNASYQFNSLLYPDFELLRFSHNFAFGFSKSTHSNSGSAKSFLSAKSRLYHLLQLHNNLREIVALVLHARQLYKDKTLGRLLNQVLKSNVDCGAHKEEYYLDAMSYIIRMCSLEDVGKYPEYTENAISTFSDGTYRSVCRDLLNSRWVYTDRHTTFSGEFWLPLKLGNILKNYLKGTFTYPIKDMYTCSATTHVSKAKSIGGENDDDECKPFDSFEIAHALAFLNLDANIKVITSDEKVENYTLISHGHETHRNEKRISVSKCHNTLYNDSLNRIDIMDNYDAIVRSGLDLRGIEITGNDEVLSLTNGDKLNRDLSQAFLSKIHSLLIEFPGCTLREIQTLTPTISERHAIFLVDELISQNLAYSIEIPDDTKIADFFSVDSNTSKATIKCYFTNIPR